MATRKLASLHTETGTENSLMVACEKLSGLSQIVDNYDTFIVDLWGVVHNGVEPFPGVLDCLNSLKAAGKLVVFLSNAPRRAQAAQSQLVTRGVLEEHYDALYTSGEDCYIHLRDRPTEFYQSLGKKFYHLGGEKDSSLFDGLDLEKVDRLGDADFVLNSGPSGWVETIDSYKELLEDAQAKGLPMVCANPDRRVKYKDMLAVCAGELAAHYEKIGGFVQYHGKPHPSIFHNFFKTLPKPLESAIMIGDSFATDIKGSNQANISSIFIKGGIHKDIFEGNHSTEEGLSQLSREYGATPDFVMDLLAW